MNINPSISQRKIKNRRRDGTRVQYSRYVVEFRDPRTGRRKAKKFERRQDAVAYRFKSHHRATEDRRASSQNEGTFEKRHFCAAGLMFPRVSLV
jgi:hypothetical protein